MQIFLREAIQKNKEYQKGKVPKRWEGVNLKTQFFKIKNKEFFARRDGVRVKMYLFFTQFKVVS